MNWKEVFFGVRHRPPEETFLGAEALVGPIDWDFKEGARSSRQEELGTERSERRGEALLAPESIAVPVLGAVDLEQFSDYSTPVKDFIITALIVGIVVGAAVLVAEGARDLYEFFWLLYF